MTVATTAAKAGPYTGNDVTGSFAFSFKVFADTDIRVVETLISTGIETDLVLNDANGYTVTRNADQDNNPGGTVTYKLAGITAALPSTKKLTIVGDFTFEQPTDLPNGGPYFASVVENSLDRLELHIKQLKEVVDRAVVVDVSSTDDPDDLIDDLIAASVAAAASATAAAASAATAAGLLDDFDDLYLGAKAVAPTLDNDGDALVDGALYWNTVSKRLFAYDTGTASWIDALADAANVTYTTPSGTITDVAAMLDKQAPRIIHKNFAYDYTTETIVVRDGSSDTYHRHFGGIAEGIDGRLHLIYRRAPEHALTSGATIYYTYSDDGGATWSAETILVAGISGFDQRGMSICCTPTGRLVVIYDKVVVPSAAPTVMRLVYSDDNGVTWTQGTDIVTIAFAYARAYGRIKLIPGGSNSTHRLAWTPYYQSGSGPSTFKVPVWTSEDDGLTWAEGTPIVNSTIGDNETEMVAITSQVWFAVSRGASGLRLYVTTDKGATWTAVGIVTGTTSDSQVAPSLDKFYWHGSWFLVIGYCNRATDTAHFRICNAATALADATAFTTLISGATDMVNASGYQAAVTKPDGSLYVEGGSACVEFKEYVGFDYSQVRFVRFDLLNSFLKTLNIELDTDHALFSDTNVKIVIDRDNNGTGSAFTILKDGLPGAGSTIFTVQEDGKIVGSGASVFTNPGNLNLLVGGAAIAGITTNAASTSARPHLYFENPNGLVGSITTSASATAYNTSSDYRIKHNYARLADARERVLAIPVWRGEMAGNVPGKQVDYFIAHELAAVVPEAVHGEKDAVQEIGSITNVLGEIVRSNTPCPEVLDEGCMWVKTGERPVLQGVDQSKLVPLLTAALQDAFAEIATLKERLDAAGL